MRRDEPLHAVARRDEHCRTQAVDASAASPTTLSVTVHVSSIRREAPERLYPRPCTVSHPSQKRGHIATGPLDEQIEHVKAVPTPEPGRVTGLVNTFTLTSPRCAALMTDVCVSPIRGRGAVRTWWVQYRRQFTSITSYGARFERRAHVGQRKIVRPTRVWQRFAVLVYLTRDRSPEAERVSRFARCPRVHCEKGRAPHEVAT